MKHLPWWSLAVALLVMAWPSAARACSCLPPPPPAEALDRADLVFEGTPVGETRDGHMRRFTFTVSRVWKGEAAESVEVLTGQDSAMCGRNYDTAASYVVYASRREDGAFIDTICSRTRRSEDATEDLGVLGEGRTPGASSDDGEPTAGPAEAPRIEPPPAGSSAGTTPRGCAVGEKPHAAWALFALVLGGGAVATRRRCTVRSS